MKLTDIKTRNASIAASAAGLAEIQRIQRAEAEAACGNPNGSSLPAEYGTN